MTTARPLNVMPQTAAALIAHRYPAIAAGHKTVLIEVISNVARSVSDARAALESFTEPPSAEELIERLERPPE